MSSVSSRLAWGLGALLACSAVVAPAHAQWTLNNTNGGNGYLDPIDPLNDYPFENYSWVMTGSDLLGDGDAPDSIETLTTITDTALADGSQTFSWFYFTSDEPAYDPAGYFVNGDFHQLSHDCGCDPYEYSTVTFDLHAGDTFGFYIDSIDNRYGPSFLFVAPGEVGPDFPAVPEPASWAMMVAGFGLAGAAMRARRNTVVTFA